MAQRVEGTSGIQSVPMADMAMMVREQGQGVIQRLGHKAFLLVAYAPPVGEHWGEKQTAETRLGGSPNVNMPVKFTEVVPIAATKRNKGGGEPPGITLGRTDENDIVIRAFGISKEHAVFVEGEKDGLIQLVDRGSANGTTVNGTTLEPDKPLKLHNGDVITFWWFVFEFAYPDAFLRTLQNNDW
jgi:hypothetical protein